MHMTFWFGYKIEELLFSNLSINSTTGLVIACICLCALAILYESLKLGLAETKLYSNILRSAKPRSNLSEDTVLIQDVSNSERKRLAWFSLEISLYIIEIVLGYILMLVVMTYNIYILLVVLIGAGLGYGLVGQKILMIRLKSTKLKVPCQTCSSVARRNMSRGSSSSNSMTETTIETNCCSNRSTSPQTMTSPT